MTDDDDILEAVAASEARKKAGHPDEMLSSQEANRRLSKAADLLMKLQKSRAPKK